MRITPKNCSIQFITVLRKGLPHPSAGLILSITFTLFASLHSFNAFSQGARSVVLTQAEIIRQAVSEKTVEGPVRFLSDSICGGRATGTDGNSEAAMFILRQYSSIGIQPLAEGYVQGFQTGSGQRGRDLVGFIPGSSDPGSYVLVMAYYDGLGELDGKLYPGADNNASGVSAMLGMARMMKAGQRMMKNYRRSVIFVALDAKYSGMGGSRRLWSLLKYGLLSDPRNGRKITLDDIALTINIDQIGSTLSPIHEGKDRYLIMLGGEDYRKGALSSCNSIPELGLDLGFDYYGSRDFTRIIYRSFGDQKVFVEGGKEAVMFTSGLTMKNNKSDDTPDSLDMKVLKERTWLMFHFLERSL